MAVQLKIPKSFQIFGQTIKVKWRKTLYKDKRYTANPKEDETWAVWEPKKNEILVQIPCTQLPLTQEQLEQTFLHEVTHACLDLLNYEKLSEDEEFVDRFSKALHQALKTGILSDDG